MLGSELLVAPVFSADGLVDFYLPAGKWTNYFSGEVVESPTWRTEHHGYGSIPLYVRDGAVIPVGARDDRPDYDYLDGLSLDVYPSSTRAERVVVVTNPSGESSVFQIGGDSQEPTVVSTPSVPVIVRSIGKSGLTPE
jgi:alpha-D-xyloside xylohydrolase